MFKKALILTLLLVCGMLFAQAAIDYTAALPTDPDLKIGKLPNGLTYYIKVNHKPEKRAELRLAVNVGSVQEDDDQQGLAHFTEHMAFNGIKHFKKSELVDYLNSIGMGYANGLNGMTSLDQTVYQLQIPTDNQEQFRKAFLIAGDWANGISFDPEELNKERGVVIEEWRGGQGAEERIYDKQRQVIFAGSKYAERMPIGKLETLQSFTLQTIKRFYDDWYRPDLQAIIAVGDFDAALVEQLIIENFGKIPVKVNPREAVIYNVPDNVEPKVVIAVDKEAPETSVQLIWKHEKPDVKTVGDYRRSLVRNLFTQMLNSRLQEITQQADPPFSEAYNFNYNIVRSKSNYSLLASVQENSILRGLTTLLTEAERVKKYGFTESELDRAKQVAIRSSERTLAEKDKQDSGRLVWRYVSNFTIGNPVMGIEQNVALNKQLYAEIGMADVIDVCRELITDTNLVIAVSAPEKEGLVIPGESDLLGLLAQVKTAEIAPYVDNVSTEALLPADLQPGRIISEKIYTKPGLKQWKLNNGATVLYKQTNFKNDEVLLRAFSPGGASLYKLEDLYEAMEAANIIIDSGVGSFDATALAKKLAGKIVHVDPYIDTQEEGFRANCSKADMETMFQLIYLYATAPKLDEKSFAGWQSRTKAWMENEALNPESCYSDSVWAALANNHPFAKRMKAEDIPNLDMKRVLQIYKERFADFSDFTFVIVGSFDELQLKGFCEKYLANLPARGLKEKIKDTGIRYAKGKKEVTVYKGQDDKSTVQFMITGNCDMNDRTQSRVNNLRFLLNEKLRENIRETRSGVYFIAAWDYETKYPVSTFLINVYMQCAPDRVEELSQAVIGTLDSLKAGLIDEKYVNVIKVTRQKQLETDLAENRWWLENVYEKAWNKLPLEGLLNDEQEIAKLNLKELQKVAKQYLIQDQNLMRGVLYPLSKSEGMQEMED
jgi:zinc protease